MQNSAVVFAYHSVGVRCIKTLLARGINIALVVTHEDSPTETIWFESVAKLCEQKNIPYITPSDAKSPELLAIDFKHRTRFHIQLLLSQHAPRINFKHP